MAAISAPPAPETAEDLAREGLLFLLRICVPVITRHDLARARWHELVQAAERASAAWTRASQDHDALVAAKPAPGHRNRRAYHEAWAAIAAAAEREERAWKASRRAYDAATAFFEAHVCPPTPTPATPALEEAS